MRESYLEFEFGYVKRQHSGVVDAARGLEEFITVGNLALPSRTFIPLGKRRIFQGLE